MGVKDMPDDNFPDTLWIDPTDGQGDWSRQKFGRFGIKYYRSRDCKPKPTEPEFKVNDSVVYKNYGKCKIISIAEFGCHAVSVANGTEYVIINSEYGTDMRHFAQPFKVGDDVITLFTDNICRIVKGITDGFLVRGYITNKETAITASDITRHATAADWIVEKDGVKWEAEYNGTGWINIYADGVRKSGYSTSEAISKHNKVMKQLCDGWLPIKERSSNES